MERNNLLVKLSVNHQFLRLIEACTNSLHTGRGAGIVETCAQQSGNIVRSLPKKTSIQLHQLKKSIAAIRFWEGQKITQMASIVRDESTDLFLAGGILAA